MSLFLQRAILLIEQSRFELAESELKRILEQDPDDAQAHSLLAVCQVRMEKYREASASAQLAIQLAPDSAYSFYAASLVSDARDQLKQAEAEISEAISLSHTEPEFFAQLASIYLQQKKWNAAREAADKGLELDPEDVTCTNLRAVALVKLGMRSEAGAAIQTALENDPEDAVSHANMGWALLDRRQPKQAMPHFREALRLEPDMEWARAGILEAMKSHYFIYRILLSWFLWASKLDGRTLIFVVVGGYIGVNVATRVAAANPALRPFLVPLIVLYVSFVILTWIAVPMFNLLLRFNRFGRLALSDEEKRTSTWVGICLLAAILFVGVYWFVGHDAFLIPALAAGLMTPIIGSFYQSNIGWPRAVHALLVWGLGLFTLTAIGFAVASLFTSDDVQKGFYVLLMMSLTPLVVIGVASQFGVGFLNQARVVKGGGSARPILIVGGVLLAVSSLLFWIFSALVVWAMANLESPEMGMPIRIQLNRIENADWDNSQRMATATQELKSLGFEPAGDYEVVDIKDNQVRYFLHQNRRFVAELMESGVDHQMDTSMNALFEDDRGITLTDSSNLTESFPEWEYRFVSMSSAEMLEALEKETEGKDVQKLTPVEIPKIAESLYARYVDHVVNQGGLSDEFVRRQAKRLDMELDDADLQAFQTRWRKDMDARIKKFVIDEFVREHPEYQGQEKSMFCINGFQYKTENEFGIDDPDGFRETFRNSSMSASLKFLGTVESPITSDVYVKNK